MIPYTRDIALWRHRRWTWDPTTVGSLIGHWRADYGCDQADGSACGDGNAVQTWRPVWGAVNLVAPGADSRPVWRTGAFGPMPGVDFDGTDDYLTGNDLAAYFTGADKPMTAVAAVLPDASALQSVIGMGSSAAAAQYRMCYQTGAGDNYLSGYNRDDASSEKTATSTLAVANGAAHIVAWRWNGTTIDMWVDGAAGDLGRDVDVGALTLDEFYVGVGRVHTSLVNPMNGKIGALMVFAAALSDSDVENSTYYVSELYCRTVPIVPPIGE